MTKQHIHQIWIGDELPETEKHLTQALKEQVEGLGIGYTLWTLKEIEEAYGNEEIFFFFKRIFYKHPHPHLLKVAVDYYKWRVLADTPEDTVAYYLDVSSKLQASKFPSISTKYADVGVTANSDNAAQMAYAKGGVGAKIIAKAIEEAINNFFDLSDPEFDWQLLDNYKPYSDNDKLQIHTRAFFLKVLGTELATIPVQTYGTQSAATIRRLRLSTQKSPEDLTALHESLVKEYEAKHEPKVPTLCVLMSTAGEYDKSSPRTLNGLLTAEQLRQVQRVTTFSQELHALALRYFFVMDTAPTEGDSDSLFIRDMMGADFKGAKMYKALNWVVQNIEPDYVFLCSDDTFVNLPRLEDYCKRHRPGELVAIVSTDKENTPQIGGGVLLTAAAARKLVSLDKFPQESETFGAFLLRVADGAYAITPEPRLSYYKTAYPARKNRYITAHGLNPYDLLALYEENFG